MPVPLHNIVGSPASPSEVVPDYFKTAGGVMLSLGIYGSAKINFPFPFLTQQEKRSRTDRAVGVPRLLYALRIFS